MLGSGSFSVLHVDSSKLLIADPGYIGIYHEKPKLRDLISGLCRLSDFWSDRHKWVESIRDRASFAFDFGGDGVWSVWGDREHLVIPISNHLETEVVYETSCFTELSENIGVDSASLVFLPFGSWIPEALRLEVERCVQKKLVGVVDVRPGRWGVYYEQFDTPDDQPKELYRNIVLRWESK